MERTQLKLYRLQQKMSQAEFAKQLGYSRGQYARIENGVKEVQLKMLVALAEFSGRTLDEVRKLTKVDNETLN